MSELLAVTRRESVRFVALVVVLVLVVVGPPLVLDSSDVLLWSNAGLYGLLSLGLCATFSYTGQLSLALGVLGPVTGYTIGLIGAKTNLSLTIALLCGVGAATVMSVVLIPLLRLRGFYFAVATILGSLLVGSFFPNELGRYTGYFNGLILKNLTIGTHTFFEPNFRYTVVWVVLALTILFFRNVERTRLVRGARVVKASPLIAASLGLSTIRVLAQMFILSGVVTGIGSALLVGASGSISPGTFDFSLAVSIFVGVVIGGRRGWVGAIIGAVFVTLVSKVLSTNIDVAPLVYGAVLLVTVGLLPGGIVSLPSEVSRQIHRWRSRSGSPQPIGPSQPVRTVETENLEVLTDEIKDSRAVQLAQTGATYLVIDDVRLSYGGLNVLKGVSLSITRGEILGLVGTNGAGKSTLLNVISGYSKPDAGSLIVNGADLTGSAPDVLRRHGVVRAFQVPQVFAELTVWENIALGMDIQESFGVIRAGLSTPRVWKSEKRVRAKAAELAALVDLSGFEHRYGSELSLGQRRLVELARCLGAEANLLLLDEPFAGLSVKMIASVQDMLLRLAAGGCAVLVIDHNIAELARIADEAVFLNEGRVESRGSISNLLDNPLVARNYVGIHQ